MTVNQCLRFFLHARFLAVSLSLASGLVHAAQWVDDGEYYTNRYWWSDGKEVTSESVGDWHIATKEGVSVKGLPPGVRTHCRDLGFPYAPAVPGSVCHDYDNPVATDVYTVYSSISGTQSASMTTVYFYEHENYGGRNIARTDGKPYSDLSQVNYPDITKNTGENWARRISSVKIPHGLTVRLCDIANIGGNCVPLQGDHPSLGDFNDRAVSIQIFPTQRD